MQLRLQTFDDVINETPITDLPVAFQGDADDCKAYANDLGFIWRDSPKFLFGGYWYRKPTNVEPSAALLPS